MGSRMKLKFWKQGATIRATDTIVLRDVKESDKPSYIKLQYQYSIIKSMLKDEPGRELLWKEHTTHQGIGYAAVKALVNEIKERVGENENLDSINDRLIEVAEKFGVEPGRLLSHVLEYRLTN